MTSPKCLIYILTMSTTNPWPSNRCGLISQALCLAEHHEQQKINANKLQQVYQSWEDEAGGQSFDVFADMVDYSHPDLPEAEILKMYQKATSGDDPDAVEMKHVESYIRKQHMILRFKSGSKAVHSAQHEAGAQEMTVTVPAALSDPLAKTASMFRGDGGTSRWKRAVKTVARQNAMIRDLFGKEGLP